MVFSLAAYGILLAGCREKAESQVLNKGIQYVNKGMYEEAIKELDRAIQINPRSDRAYYNRARAYAAKGAVQQAITDYSKTIDINWVASIQSAYNNRGLLYEKLGNFDSALSDYTKGIEVLANPKFSGYRRFKAVLLANRASLYLKRKDYDNAWADVRSVKRMGFEVEPDLLNSLKRASRK